MSVLLFWLCWLCVSEFQTVARKLKMVSSETVAKIFICIHSKYLLEIIIIIIIIIIINRLVRY